MTARIVIQCAGNARGRWRHRWELVPGTMADATHPYVERRCKLCREYESDVR